MSRGYDSIKEIKMRNEIIAVGYHDGTYLILKLNNFMDFICSVDAITLTLIQTRVNSMTINDVRNDISTNEASP